MPDNRTEEMLREIQENRQELHRMVQDLGKFRKNLDILLPEKVDYKNRFILAERMKSVTEILKSELAVRKGIDDSVKLEFDLRKKSDEAEEASRSQDVRAMAQLIESMEAEAKPDSVVEH